MLETFEVYLLHQMNCNSIWRCILFVKNHFTHESLLHIEWWDRQDSGWKRERERLRNSLLTVYMKRTECDTHSSTDYEYFSVTFTDFLMRDCGKNHKHYRKYRHIHKKLSCKNYIFICVCEAYEQNPDALFICKTIIPNWNWMIWKLTVFTKHKSINAYLFKHWCGLIVETSKCIYMNI